MGADGRDHNRARDERRRKARWNREHGARRNAALRRELAKRHARGDYRAEARLAHKSAIRDSADLILAVARARVRVPRDVFPFAVPCALLRGEHPSAHLGRTKHGDCIPCSVEANRAAYGSLDA